MEYMTRIFKICIWDLGPMHGPLGPLAQNLGFGPHAWSLRTPGPKKIYGMLKKLV